MIGLFIIGMGLLLVGAVFWADVCEWFSEHANPWLQQNVPSLAPYILNAFKFIDENVGVPTRRAVVKAWKKVRSYVLQASVEFDKVGGRYIRRVHSFLQDKLGEDAKIVERKEETEVAYENLPESVRVAMMERRKAANVDFIKFRDQELLSMEQGA